MEFAELLKAIPYGKAGMVVGFVCVIMIIILFFQDRLHKRIFDYLSRRDHKD